MTAKEYKIALKNRPELTADDDETRTFPKWRQKFELWGEDDHDIYNRNTFHWRAFSSFWLRAVGAGWLGIRSVTPFWREFLSCLIMRVGKWRNNQNFFFPRRGHDFRKNHQASILFYWFSFNKSVLLLEEKLKFVLMGKVLFSPPDQWKMPCIVNESCFSFGKKNSSQTITRAIWDLDASENCFLRESF